MWYVGNIQYCLQSFERWVIFLKKSAITVIFLMLHNTPRILSLALVKVKVGEGVGEGFQM